jgi:hypothetical protein
MVVEQLPYVPLVKGLNPAAVGTGGTKIVKNGQTIAALNTGPFLFNFLLNKFNIIVIKRFVSHFHHSLIFEYLQARP